MQRYVFFELLKIVFVFIHEKLVLYIIYDKHHFQFEASCDDFPVQQSFPFEEHKLRLHYKLLITYEL